MNKENKMKETLEIVKQNAWSALFAALFGWSVGLNIKQYKDAQNDAEYIKDINQVLDKNIEATVVLLDAFDASVTIIKNDSITVPKKFKTDSYKAMDIILEADSIIDEFNKKYQ